MSGVRRFLGCLVVLAACSPDAPAETGAGDAAAAPDGATAGPDAAGSPDSGDGSIPSDAPTGDSGPDGGPTPVTLPSSGVCTNDGWCLRNPQPLLSKSFDAVWGTASTDVWVGGIGTIAHFDGATWRGRTGLGATDIMGLFGTASNDVWAIVDGKTLWRWDGTAWQVPTFASPFSVAAGWARTSTDAWLVGQSGTILHWNGATWASTTSGTVEDLTGVFGFAANDVWAVGGASVRHWDGTAWGAPAAPLPTGALARHVWGAAANDLWVQGDTAVYHWGGTAWTTNVASNMQSGRGVWGSGPNDVFFLGGDRSYRWSGTDIGTVLFGAPCAFNAVWTPPGAPAGYTLVSAFINLTNTTLCGVWQYSGGSLGTIATSWSVTPTGASGDAWFSTNGASVYHGFGSTTPVAWGSTSTAVGAITPRATSDVWISGQSGGIVSHFDGTSWTPGAIGGPVSVTKVWSNASNDAWVGAGTHAYHWDGSAWNDTGALPAAPLVVIGFGAGSAFAAVPVQAGVTGNLYAYAAGAWTHVAAMTDNAYSLWGTAANDVRALTLQAQPRFWRFDGTTWTSTAAPGTAPPKLDGVVWISGSDVWAVNGGTSGPYHWDGSSWTSSTLVDGYLATSIGGSSATDLWLVGDMGTVWHRGP
jgi:hypothetical protein